MPYTRRKAKKKIKLFSDTTDKLLCDTCTIQHKSTINKRRHYMNPLTFDSIMTRRIRRLIKKDTTIKDIRQHLIDKYPNYQKQITMEAIKSCIQSDYALEYPTTEEEEEVTVKEEKLKIEYENSIFIDEAMIVLNTTTRSAEEEEESGSEGSEGSEEGSGSKEGESDQGSSASETETEEQGEVQKTQMDIHLMCAISSRGLEKLDISLSKRHCSYAFISSVITLLPRGEPFQFVVKSNVDDITEVEKLFVARQCLHTLYYYPTTSGITNPVRKYISKLAGECLPKEPHIEKDQDVELLFKLATKKIHKRDCQRWIQKYLNSC